MTMLAAAPAAPLAAELTGPGLAGIVICGTGKTTLAAEVTTRIRDREPGRILVSLAGSLTIDGTLATSCPPSAGTCWSVVRKRRDGPGAGRRRPG